MPKFSIIYRPSMIAGAASFLLGLYSIFEFRKHAMDDFVGWLILILLSLALCLIGVGLMFFGRRRTH